MHDHKDENTTGKKLLFSVVLNAAITLTEIIGGIISGSLSLLSDSFHNFNDTMAIFIAYIAKIIGKKPENDRYTYGYKRYETLAAFINTLFLMAISIFLTIEGIKKFINPTPINGNLMISVAFIGLGANFFTMILLLKDSKGSLNLKAMFVHILGDTFSSIAIIIGAFFIIKYNFYILDPIFTLMISFYIFIESFKLLREITRILLQGVPEEYKIEDIKNVVEKKFDFIDNLHKIHLWSTDGNDIYMETHVKIKEKCRLSESEQYIYQIKKILKDKFKITNCTIQIEKKRCLE